MVTVAKALAASLGKASVEKADVEDFVRKAARDKTLETMKTCLDTSTQDNTGRDACRDTTVKAAISESMGKPLADVNPTEIREFVKKGAESEAGDNMRDCMANADSGPKRTACQASAKAAVTKAMGKGSI